MQTSSSKSAFSLIELSIVILVIGILIAGALQGSKLLDSFKLNTARTLTKSSPIAGIKGLVAWYETTSLESFDSTISQDSSSNTISTWYDINSQSQLKNNGTQSGTKRPTYTIDAKTSLPMIYFDGSNDGFYLPNGTIPSGDNSYTVVIVAKPLSNATFDKTFLSTEDTLNLNNNIFRYRSNTFNNLAFVSGSSVADGKATITMNKIIILGSSYSNGYSNTYLNNGSRVMTVTLNGTAANTTPTGSLTSPTVNNAIGLRKFNGGEGDAFYGYIGEIIIFNRYLKPEETNAIWKYLGQKWGVTVSIS